MFDPDVKIAVIWNWVKYNSTYKYDITIGEARQALLDTPATRNDAGSFKKTMNSFEVDMKDNGEDGVYVKEDPTPKDHAKLLRDLKARFRNNPRKKHCILYCFAAHGGVSSGLQCLVHNEFDQRSRWYKLFRAEYFIRQMATKFKNTYQVVFFAACRQVFDTPK